MQAPKTYIARPVTSKSKAMDAAFSDAGIAHYRAKNYKSLVAAALRAGHTGATHSH